MFLSLFKFSPPRTAHININAKKSKIRDLKRNPMVIIEVNYTYYYLTSLLTIQQAKQRPLDVLTYLLAKDTNHLNKMLQDQENAVIKINAQYFDISMLNIEALKEQGKQQFGVTM